MKKLDRVDVLTHVDARGNASMVDVSAKDITDREAIASACLRMRPDVLALLVDGRLPKGDVLAVARVAGIQGAKRTSELIPLCHPLSLSKVAIEFEWDASQGELTVTCRCRVHDRTGVEMEAMTGASVAALTIYDMCKAAQRDIVISDVQLLAKSGGKSGEFIRQNTTTVRSEKQKADANARRTRTRPSHETGAPRRKR